MPVKTRNRSNEESNSPNLRPRQQQRTSMDTNNSSNLSVEQLLQVIQQQQQMFQQAMKEQVEQSNKKFEQIMQNNGDKEKKNPPKYEGRIHEDLELWIYATQKHYAKQKSQMEQNSQLFVDKIYNNLGTTPQNWFREFEKTCNSEGIILNWNTFKQGIRKRFRPKDFEYNLRMRLLYMKPQGSIHEYISKFQNLIAQAEEKIGDLDKRVYFQFNLRGDTAQHLNEKSPQSLEEAIELATNYENAHHSSSYTNESFKLRKPDKSRNQSKRGTNDTNKQYMLSQKQKNTVNKKKDKSQIKCYNCNEMGHYATECPKPRKERKGNEK